MATTENGRSHDETGSNSINTARYKSPIKDWGDPADATATDFRQTEPWPLSMQRLHQIAGD